MAVLNYHNFDSLGFTTGTEGPNQFYSGKQVGKVGGTGPDVEYHIEPSSNYARIGTNSLRVMLEDGVWRDGNPNGPLARSELRTQVFGGATGSPGVYDGWFSFSFLTNDIGVGSTSVVIAQLWDGGSPSMSIRYRSNNGQVFLRIYDNSSSTDYHLFYATAGVWYDTDFWYQSRTNSNGKIKVWINNSLWSGSGIVDGVLTRQNIYTPEEDESTPYWKLGAYDSGFGEEGIESLTFYFDAVSYHDDTDSEQDTLEWIDNFRGGDPDPEEFTITVIPSTGGSVSGGGVYEEGQSVTLSATPNSGWTFVKWSNEVTANPYSFTASENLTISAIFEEVNPEVPYIIVKGKFKIV